MSLLSLREYDRDAESYLPPSLHRLRWWIVSEPDQRLTPSQWIARCCLNARVKRMTSHIRSSTAVFELSYRSSGVGLETT